MKIAEKNGMVIIDGFEFYGDIQHGKPCSTCEHDLIYYDEFDTYFCPECNCWTEAKCSDSDCFYCPKRPETPLPQK